MNRTQALVGAAFLLLGVILLLWGAVQTPGSPARRARTRAGFVFAIVGVLMWTFYLGRK